MKPEQLTLPKTELPQTHDIPCAKMADLCLWLQARDNCVVNWDVLGVADGYRVELQHRMIIPDEFLKFPPEREEKSKDFDESVGF